MANCQPWLSLIPPLQQLLGQGVCQPDKSIHDKLAILLSTIAAPGQPAIPTDTKQTKKQQFVAAHPLLQLRQRLDNDQEAIAAILATQKEVRTPWLSIMAARLKEAGQMAQPERLVQLVTTLGKAASWVESALPKAKLTGSYLAPLERQLFNTVAESAPAVPILCRVLAAAAWLDYRQQTVPAISPVDESGERPDQNWCKGRLLQLPASQTSSHAALQSYLLSGSTDHQPQEESKQDPLPWVLLNPWAFLLTSVVYAQDSWAAEQRGGLLLELPSGQNPYAPSQIQVLVARADGAEILCGSLADLMLRWLARRQIHLFPTTLAPQELDSRLTPVVQALLSNKVWRYTDGLSGEQGYYKIN